MNLSRETTLDDFISEDFNYGVHMAQTNPALTAAAQKIIGSRQPTLIQAYTQRLNTRTQTFLTLGSRESVTPVEESNQVWCGDTNEVF